MNFLTLAAIIINVAIFEADSKCLSWETKQEIPGAVCSEEEKKALGDAYNQCTATAFRDFQLESSKMRIEGLTPEESNWCDIYEDVVSADL